MGAMSIPATVFFLHFCHLNSGVQHFITYFTLLTTKKKKNRKYNKVVKSQPLNTPSYLNGWLIATDSKNGINLKNP